MIPSSVTTASSGTSCAAAPMLSELLEGIRQPDEARPLPAAAHMAEREGAIVVTAPGAEAHAIAIEAHQRQEHRRRASVRRASAPSAARRFPGGCAATGRASPRSACRARRGAGRCVAGRCGSRDLRAMAMSGAASSSQGSAAYKAMRQRPCRRTARAALRATIRERRSRSPADSARRRALRLARSDLRAAFTEVSGSATRRCRCDPLLSNQSNKWDELRQVRLSAHRRTCTCCTQALSPEGVSIRVRGNPARLSNTAGDAWSTLHQMQCA